MAKGLRNSSDVVPSLCLAKPGTERQTESEGETCNIPQEYLIKIPKGRTLKGVFPRPPRASVERLKRIYHLAKIGRKTQV